jgi:hypothetical protein
MIKTWTEEARDQERQLGLERTRKIFRVMLEKRFGPLSEPVRQKLAVLSIDQLEALGEALMTAQSLLELGLEDDANEAAT